MVIFSLYYFKHEFCNAWIALVGANSLRHGLKWIGAAV